MRVLTMLGAASALLLGTGAEAAQKVGELRSVHVIARPIDKLKDSIGI